MVVEGPTVLCVAGSSHADSATAKCLSHVMKLLQDAGVPSSLLDLALSPLPLFHPQSGRGMAAFHAVQERILRADVLVLGTPDYHGCMSGVLKNFLDYLWLELAGRLVVPLVVSNEKGLTVLDQIRTVARQCYAWTLPYGVSVSEKTDLQGDAVMSESLSRRMEMLARDIRVYGAVLAAQRRADLASMEPGFMARYRRPDGSNRL